MQLFKIYPKNLNNNYLIFSLFLIFLLESFLLGSGRLLEIGNITAKMLLFTTALTFSILMVLYRNKISRLIMVLLHSFILLILTSLFLGLLNGARPELIIEDIKPLMFFLIIIYLYLMIKNKSDINIIVKFIKISGLLLAISYLSFLAVMYFGYLDFGTVYSFLSSNSSDFFFRGSSNENATFFYKGFLYLNIGFLFLIMSTKKLDKFLSLIILVAIILTLTRGFLLTLFLSFFLMFLLEFKKKKNFVWLIIFVTPILAFAPVIIEYLFLSRIESDAIRTVQIKQVFQNMNFVSLLIGHGFGIGIPVREVHMEIAFLEILHKQGVLGLLFWFTILAITIKQYFLIKSKTNVSKAFLMSSFFVYLQSFTNPFINNPIGMAMVIISLLCLIQIKKDQNEFININSNL